MIINGFELYFDTAGDRYVAQLEGLKIYICKKNLLDVMLEFPPDQKKNIFDLLFKLFLPSFGRHRCKFTGPHSLQGYFQRIRYPGRGGKRGNQR